MLQRYGINRRKLGIGLAVGGASCVTTGIVPGDRQSCPASAKATRSSGVVSPEQFGAMGDGETLDLTAWRQALAVAANTHAVIECRSGSRYWLGPVSNADPLLLVNGGDLWIEGNGARLMVNTAFRGIGAPLTVNSPRTFGVRNLAFSDAGYESRATWKGSHFLLFNGGAQDSHSITIENCSADGALSFATFGSGNAAGRLRQVRLQGRNTASHCYYGLCFQAQGDTVSGSLACVDVRRAYLAHGCCDHDLNLDIRTQRTFQPGSNGCILVASVTDRFNRVRATRNIRIRARARGELVRYGSLVLFQLQSDNQSAEITDIDVELNAGEARGQLSTKAFAFRSYSLDSRESQSQAEGVWDRIRLSGDSVSGNAFYIGAVPSKRGSLIIDISGGIELPSLPARLRRAFNISLRRS